MNNSASLVSVVIRARNVEMDLRRLLPRLRAQRIPLRAELEIIVVDNDSTDDTAAIAGDFGARVVHLPTMEFTWGGALNLGIAEARGSIVILLSADAVPVGEDWLIGICKPFEANEVAVVYGQQVPRSSAPLDEWIRVRAFFPSEFRAWSVADLDGGRTKGLIASNACAALRREVWETFRYDEDSHGAEELPWTAQVLVAGYTACYTADVCVEHSHRDSALRQAVRLWELELENGRQAGYPVRWLRALRVVVSFAKRRILNLFVPEAGIWRRCEGLVRLPWESLLLLVVSVSSIAGFDIDNLCRRRRQPVEREG